MIAKMPVPALLGLSVVFGLLMGAVASPGNPAVPSTREQAAERLDRTVLPIPEPADPPIKALDARDAKAPARFEVKAPGKAPNVLIVLIDDMGFGQSSAFGGPIHMPTVERLAKGGLRYNQFHTTALCSPTRAGAPDRRNHHVCNMGSITETATAFPGQTGQRPEQRRTVGRDAAAQRLQPPPRSASRTRPRPGRSARPARPIAGRLAPASTSSTGSSAARRTSGRRRIYDGMNRVEPPKDPNYHFMTDMTNQAINWTKRQ